MHQFFTAPGQATGGYLEDDVEVGRRHGDKSNQINSWTKGGVHLIRIEGKA